MTKTKSVIEKYAENVLVAVEMADEVLTVFDDQPWSTSIQLALSVLRLTILLYLTAAENEPAPEADPADTQHTSPIARAGASAATVEAEESATDSQHTSSPDDPAANEQSDPQQQ